MLAHHKRSVLNRLKTVRGHLDAVIGMVDEEHYCPQVMKQISALQSALERANRVLLQNHLETCVPYAIAEGRGQHIVDELMETLRYTGALTGPLAENGAGGGPKRETMTDRTLTVPDMSCGHCKASIEGALRDMAGLSRLTVRLDDKQVDVSYDESTLSLDAIKAAIEGQGFDVADA